MNIETIEVTGCPDCPFCYQLEPGFVDRDEVEEHCALLGHCVSDEGKEGLDEDEDQVIPDGWKPADCPLREAVTKVVLKEESDDE